jgi:4-amino-4-deoxy-L-arabinose transferase-like glycosyltransferase
VLLAGALPWSFVLLGAWRRLAALVTARDADAVLFIAWIVTPFVFFSLSQSKRPQYLVPVIPAVGLLVAHLWRSAQDGFTGSRVAAAALGALSITVGLGAGAIARMFGASTAVQAAVPASGWIIAACGIAGAAAALAVRTRHAIVLGLALPTAVLPIAAGPVMDAVARERSSGEIAAAIRPALGETTRIVAAGTFPLSLPYYLRRPVILASADGAELTSNYVLRSPAMRYIDGSPLRPADWWRDAVITCDRPTIVVVRQDDQARRAVLAARLALLIETTRYAVYGPCGKSDMATASRHGPLS